jgi:hypothetical protein
VALGVGAAVSLLGAGCRCGQDAPSVATVVSFVPATEVAVAGADWTAADRGGRLRVGDALRTGETGAAVLDISGHGALKVARSSLVRFTSLGGADRGGSELRLSIENGSLEASSSPEADAPLLVIDGPTGLLRLRRGATASLTVEEGRQVRLNLIVGAAEIESEDGTTEVVAGQTLVLTIGEAGRVRAEVLGDQARDAGAVAAADASAPPLQADANLADMALDGTGGAVTVRLTDQAALEVRAPGSEEWAPTPRRRADVAPGTAFRVVGAGTAEIVGPQGALVVAFEGASGVVVGADGGSVRVRLGGGRAEGATTGAGTAVLVVPGGQVSTGHVGSSAAFRAAVVDRSSTRVNVTGGVATVVTDTGSAEVETGAEVMLRSGANPAVAAPREVQPVVAGGSGVIFDAQKLGDFTARFDPINGCRVYTVDLQAPGRAKNAVVTSRPWVAVHSSPYGSYRWVAKCIGAADGAALPAETREGRVSRAADGSGRRSLPSAAPRNSLDTSGGTFAVMYQNRPPAITLRWTKAPAAATYDLQVRDTSGRVVHSGQHAKASHSFRSGFFQDGQYFWFWRGAGTTSPVTKMRIEYDQQTPAIYIAEPENGAGGGGSVRVRGEAAVGSTVTVNGVPLELGPDYRFDQVVPAGKNLLVFRVATPGRGTGIYLRHLGR